MRRILAIVLALLLCGAAMAEGTGFAFRNGITWGMTEDEVLAAEGGAEHQRNEMEPGLSLIVIEDDMTTGAKGDVNYVFMNGALVMDGYYYHTGDISADELSAALSEKYGEPAPADIPRFLAVMTALHGETPPDLPEGALFWNWTLEDGTYIVLTTSWDTDMDELSLGYIDEAAILAGQSVSEPAPAMNPDGM